VIEGIVIVVALLSGLQAWWQGRRQLAAGIPAGERKGFWDYFTRNGLALAAVGMLGFIVYAVAFGVGEGPTTPLTSMTTP
jgi:uncharacterized iron-regulated membrane protein